MSFTKPKIYNLALSALLLAKEVSDTDTDTSNEVKVLNTHYDVAFDSVLQDLDLDSLSTQVTLELIVSQVSLTNRIWDYVYKYPTKCVFFRRLVSYQAVDNKDTHIPKRVANYNGQKAIYTNEVSAIAECITNDITLDLLSPMAGLALAYRLASLSAPLIVGKGAKALRERIEQQYIIAKSEAQEMDSLENFNYEADYLRSEFVFERLS